MIDQSYMLRAIKLAKEGEGWCHPNPMVGAVIVKGGRIIGEGYHARCGELHAERNAIANLSESAEGATLYVTLEPCCHYGKTPPCTEAIIEAGIRRVVIGSSDPNPKVSGGGVRALQAAGIRVETDFMRAECDALNPVFFHYIKTQTPYVIMKYAMTADGKIATRTGESKWISGEASRAEVQALRHACMGIMAGIGTVLADDPMLNCRLPEGRDPVRIICDSSLRLPTDSRIAKSAGEQETIIACAISDLPCGEIGRGKSEKTDELLDLGITLLNYPAQNAAQDSERVDLNALMRALGGRGIDSILLEGGATLNAAMLDAELVHELCVFVAPKLFGGQAPGPVAGVGVATPDAAWPLELNLAKQIGEDLMLRYKFAKERNAGRR